MASQDESNSFEAIIHADRARKKNEDLANQIFGRSKTSQNVKKNQKETRSPSLASRMGVQKRTSSTSTPPQKNPFNPPSRPSSTTPSHSFRNSRERDHQSSARASRIANEIESGNANITASRESPFTTLSKTVPRNGTQGPGLSIKGSAGPFTVHLSNFAPGTTEADIEAALATDLLDDSGENCLETCRLISSRPSVVAEMVLCDRSVADNIVSKFNNLKADGRILKVAIVKTGPNRERERDSKSVGNGIAQSIEPNVSPQDVPTSVAEGDMEMDDVDTRAEHPATSSYDHEREAADRDRRDRDRDRDRDGGYAAGGRRDNRERGHDRREDRDRDRDRDRRRDERERDRDDDRDRDREREGDRDRDRDRDYDRRDTQPQTANYNNRPAGPPPQAPYGNGFNRPPPGMGYGYGGPRGYGYHRGGYGGRGGGYRGYGR